MSICPFQQHLLYDLPLTHLKLHCFGLYIKGMKFRTRPVGTVGIFRISSLASTEIHQFHSGINTSNTELFQPYREKYRISAG